MKKIRLKKPASLTINIFIKIFIGVILPSLLFTIIYLSTGPIVMRLYEGDISLKDIYAPYDFTYTGDLDEIKMKELENEALKVISPVYKINPQTEEATLGAISLFFGHLRESQKIKELMGDDKKAKRLKKIASFKLSDQAYLELIRTKDVDYIENIIKEIVNQSLKKGILNTSDKDSLKKQKLKDIIILDPTSGEKRTQAVNGVPTLDELKIDVEKEMGEYFPKDKRLRQTALEIINTVMLSNLQFGLEETERYKIETLAKLPKIYKEVAIKKNEIIIGKGQKVTKTHLKMLMQLGKMRDLSGRFFYLIGIALLLIIFLLISVFHLRFYESETFGNNKNLLLIVLLILFIAIATQTIAISPLSSYLIPLASVSMLIGILIDANTAFIVTIIMSIVIGVVAGNNFGLMIVMFIGSSVGIYSVRRMRRRSKLLLAGVLVGIANFFTITALGFLNNLSPSLFLKEGISGIVNGLVSFLLVIGLLPVLEYLFKIPTDITLLELSDLNHPLLKEMVTKAPGTYHHSLVVGNLAEAASDAIGANSLLARVGAYYHDIGKIEKAEYFSENESEPKNSRHENLTPSMSALIIINHVKDGIEVARKYKLNQALIAFIRQHHGNGLIYYFYHRALEKAPDEKDIKEEGFRYPGPRPQTKETAIVLLADAVEASSRTLANPTPSRVESLVQKMINNKFIDGQLDECDLTLKDLHKIAIAFMRILNAMFHTRVEYPKEDEIQRSKSAKNNNKKFDQKANPSGLFNKEDNKKGS